MSVSDNSDTNSPENNAPGDGDLGSGSEKGGFKPITSQEDLDKLIASRISRVERKYAGFDELKAKAEQFDKVEAERGSDFEKLQRRAEKAEQELNSYKDKLTQAERMEMVRDIADDLGLPKKLVKRVQGATEEEIRADIEDLLDGLPSSKSDGDSQKSNDDEAGDKKPPSQKPKVKTTFTATGDESDNGLSESADDILKDVNGL